MIASLNVNGFAAPTSNLTGIEKWSTIYQSMKENKIAILAIQESHLDDSQLQSIHECFGSRLTVINSSLPENPRSSAGVAFVINRALVEAKNLAITELIEGRALALKLNWYNTEEILLINVYAPNNKTEHNTFWEEIDTVRRAKGL